MEYETHIQRHDFAGQAFDIECLVNLDKTVDDMFEELERLDSQELLEELCPYFGIVWPAARALCEWMGEQGKAAFTDKRVLEVGCGLALPSFLAAGFEARVAATDLHPDVPKFLEKNLRLNPTSKIAFSAMDWRKSDDNLETWDWILASDVLYERDYAQSLTSFLEKRIAPNGTAVISDPQRPYCDSFEMALKASSLRYLKIPRPVAGSTQSCVLFVISHSDTSAGHD